MKVLTCVAVNVQGRDTGKRKQENPGLANFLPDLKKNNFWKHN